MNGDDRTDIVGFGGAQVFVALGQGDGTFGEVQPVLDGLGYSAGGWQVSRNPRRLADVNGDGRADIVAFGETQVFAALGQSDGRFSEIRPVFNGFGFGHGWERSRQPRLLGDVNGDSRTDIVGFGQQHVLIALGQQDGTFGDIRPVLDNFGYQAGGWHGDKHPRRLGDINGDGRDDIVGFGAAQVFVALGQSDGTMGEIRAVLTGLGYNAGGWKVENHPRHLKDINGDGRDDIVGFGETQVFVALGQRDGTFGEIRAVLDGFGVSWGGDIHSRLLGDVNSDGRSDIVGFKERQVFVALGQRDGTFGSIQPVLNGFGLQDGWSGWQGKRLPRFLGDVNGDGHDDIVGFGDDGVWLGIIPQQAFVAEAVRQAVRE